MDDELLRASIGVYRPAVYCIIRKEWVAALPEELVRQRLLKYMLATLGFPESLIVVERALRQLPHLAGVDPALIPDRRADIMCFAARGEKEGDGLYPLLLVECKAVRLTSRVINQVAGYNQSVRARFICIVNDEEIRMGWFDPEKMGYVFIDYLPAFEQLSTKNTL